MMGCHDGMAGRSRGLLGKVRSWGTAIPRVHWACALETGLSGHGTLHLWPMAMAPHQATTGVTVMASSTSPAYESTSLSSSSCSDSDSDSSAWLS